MTLLTTKQAADLLGVSRPFLIKQLDAGEIGYRNVGMHRRILFRDLMEYKERTSRKRRETLRELTRYSQEIGMP